MKPEDLAVLADRASTVEGRPRERLDEVHARIQRAGRRRQAGAVGAVVVAVVLALSAATVLLNFTDTTPPANPPQPSVTPTKPPEKPEDDRPAARLLVWAEGETVHVGKRTIDAAGPVAYIDASDDGVVFVTQSSAEEDADRIWFSDGAEPVQIGRPIESGTGWVYGVKRSNPGSLLVWAEGAGSGRSRDQGDYVVYDTDQRRVLARFGGPKARIEAVYPESVYWVPNEKKWCVDFDRYHGFCRRYSGIMRYDAASGRQTRASWEEYLRGRLTQPRTLVQGDSRQIEESPYFWRVGRRLLPIAGRPSSAGSYDYRDARTTLSVAQTGEPVRLRVPADFRAADVFQLVQWLDDDRVVVFAYCCGAERRGYPGYPFGGSETADSGDLFTCRLSSGACSLAVKRSEDGYEVPLAD